MWYADLTTEEVACELGRRAVVVPIGTLEQHGPHLPLSVDCDIPLQMACAVAKRTGSLVGPLIPVGARSLPQSGGGLRGLPGTLHIRGEVLTAYLHDVLGSLVASGARRLVLLNGHYENEAFLFEAAAQLEEEGRLADSEILALSWWSLLDDAAVLAQPGAGFCGWHAEHASYVETSIMLHLRPDLVRPERVDNPSPPDAGILLIGPDAPAAALRGVLNRTSSANAQAGANLFGACVDALATRMNRAFSRRQEAGA